MDIKVLHSLLYEILCTVDAICKKEEIAYMLFGGTMLGAVRDHGFIPWDDDVDLVIWRKDYPAFCRAMKKFLPDHLKLVEPADLNPGFYDFIPRIADQRYLLHAPGDDDLYYHNLQNHVSVDIFIIENGADSRLGRELLIARQKLIYGLSLGHRYRPEWNRQNSLLNIPLRILSGIGKHIPLKLLYQWQDNLCGKRPGNCLYAIILNEIPQNMDLLNLTEWFSSAVDMPFEQSAFPVPKGYHEKLTAQYGEYMIPVKDFQKYIQHADLNYEQKQ